MGYVSTLISIQSAFENAGILFFDNDIGGGIGVRLSKQQLPPDSMRPAAVKPAAKIATLWVDGVGHGFLTLQEAVEARNQLPEDKKQRAAIESGGIEYSPSEIDRLQQK